MTHLTSLLFVVEATPEAVHPGFPDGRLFKQGQRGRIGSLTMKAAMRKEPKHRKSSLAMHMIHDMYSKVTFSMHVRRKMC